MAELEQWQKLLEPTLFQLVKAIASTIDGMLKAAVTASAASDAAESEPNLKRMGRTESIRQALRFRRAFDPGRSPNYAEKTLSDLDKVEIPYYAAVVAMEPEHGTMHVANTVSTKAVKLKHARDLAHRLRDWNPLNLSMFRCKGIVH